MKNNDKKIISELKRKLEEESRLRETYQENILNLRSRFYSILDSLNDCTFIVDDHLIILFANRPMIQFAKKIGFPGLLIGQSLKDLSPIEMEGFKEEDYREVFKTGNEIIREENTIQGKVTVKLEIRKKPIYEEGNIHKVITIIKDLTKYYATLKQLKNNEIETYELLDMLPEMIIESDANGKASSFNKNAFTKLGYSEKDITNGMEIYSLFTSLDEQRVENNFLACLDEVNVPPHEFKLKTKNEEIIPVRVYFTLIKNNREKVKVRLLLFDISDIKKRDENLNMSLRTTESIIKNLPFGIMMITDHKKIRMANPTALKILGLEEKEVIGATCEQVLHDPAIYNFETSEIKDSKKKNEIVFIRKDGKDVHLLISTLPIIFEGENVFLQTFVDISDLKEAQKALKNAKEEAEIANTAKTDFLSKMSHELRTPMNAILGYIELLETRIKDNQLKEYVKSIKTSGKDLLALINDLLDLSKIEAGKSEFKKDLIDTVSFFRNISNMFYPLAKEKQLELITNIDDNFPSSIYFDELKLKQVLINLISNSIKYTHEGAIKLTIKGDMYKTIKNETNQNHVFDIHIEVEDTGIGISKKTQDNIFNEFVQIRGTEYQKYGGTGLGLSITKNIVELLNGEISVDSTLNVGSRFTVLFKEVQLLSEPPKQHIKAEPEIDIDNIRFDNATVLIVDDNTNNLLFLSTVLMEAEIHVMEALNGKEALQIMKSKRPDLIITDIMMPEMNGFTFCKKLKESIQYKDIPIIALTASVMKETMNKLAHYNFDGTLMKPVKLTDLYNAIITFLPYKYIASDTPSTEQIEEEVQNESVPPEVINTLQGDMTKAWAKFKKKQAISEIKEFAENLFTLGKTYKIKSLMKYGENLLHSINNFDIEKTLQLINEYPEFIKIFI